MAKQRIFSRASALVGTTLDKSESVVYEGLTSVEYGFKSLTNVAEEFHNDTISDIVESRVNVAEKKASARERLLALGYTEEAVEEMLNTVRR